MANKIQKQTAVRIVDEVRKANFSDIGLPAGFDIEEYALKTAAKESSLGVSLYHRSETSSGAFAFLDQTYYDNLKAAVTRAKNESSPDYAHLKEVFDGYKPYHDRIRKASKSERLAITKQAAGYKNDVKAQVYALKEMIRDDVRLLKNNEPNPIEITQENIYFAHFAGRHGAVRILECRDNQSIEACFSDKEIAANSHINKNMTVGDYKKQSMAIFNGKSNTQLVEAAQAYSDKTKGIMLASTDPNDWGVEDVYPKSRNYKKDNEAGLFETTKDYTLRGFEGFKDAITDSSGKLSIESVIGGIGAVLYGLFRGEQGFFKNALSAIGGVLALVGIGSVVSKVTTDKSIVEHLQGWNENMPDINANDKAAAQNAAENMLSENGVSGGNEASKTDKQMVASAEQVANEKLAVNK